MLVGAAKRQTAVDMPTVATSFVAFRQQRHLLPQLYLLLHQVSSLQALRKKQVAPLLSRFRLRTSRTSKRRRNGKKEACHVRRLRSQVSPQRCFFQILLKPQLLQGW